MLLRVLALLAGFFPAALAAQDWEALKQPGAVAMMRHALAPGTGDPSEFRLDDCSTQRNLDDTGRDQARRIGDALRAQGVEFDHIWSSGWCRAYDTAALLDMGPVEIRPFLHSFFAGRGDRNAQTQEALGALGGLPADARVLLVTHQVNITALTGETLPSGAIVVVRRGTDGGLEVSGRVAIAP
jgi:broad specificity phosphatase PhoE